MGTHLQQGDSAGGHLTGTYPNPTVGNMGTGTLSGGTVTITNTAVTSSSFIFLTCTKSNTVSMGSLSVSAKVAGTGFTVISNNVLDTSPFNYMILG